MSTERRESEVIRSWLDEAYEAERGPRDFLAHLLDRVPDTPQRRRRWWPLPPTRREAQKPTDTIDYQPRPIPASNGHNPIVIGRTQSMLSPAKAITAGAIVAAIGGVMLIAQPFEQQGNVPAAATEVERAAPVEVTAHWGFGGQIRSGPSEVVDGVLESRGDAWRPGGGNSASDPRLQGRLSISVNSNTYGDGPSVDSVAFRIENDDGAWQQMPMVSPNFPGENSKNEVGVFVGEGEYEGLIAVLRITTSEGWDLHGYILDGELPPDPEPVISD